MLFAGFAVADPGQSSAHHHLTLLGIVAAGVLGNLVGSWIAYGVGRAGRLELVERHGRWLHLKPSHIAWADRWFERYGAPAIFFSRMLPIIRTFISLPAGVARMPFLRFTLLTLAGCIPWVLGLALAGEAVGHNWTNVRKGFEYVDYAVVVLVVVAIVYAILRRRRATRRHGRPRRRCCGIALAAASPRPRARARPGADRAAAGLLLGAHHADSPCCSAGPTPSSTASCASPSRSPCTPARASRWRSTCAASCSRRRGSWSVAAWR